MNKKTLAANLLHNHLIGLGRPRIIMRNAVKTLLKKHEAFQGISPGNLTDYVTQAMTWVGGQPGFDAQRSSGITLAVSFDGRKAEPKSVNFTPQEDRKSTSALMRETALTFLQASPGEWKSSVDLHKAIYAAVPAAKKMSKASVYLACSQMVKAAPDVKVKTEASGPRLGQTKFYCFGAPKPAEVEKVAPTVSLVTLDNKPSIFEEETPSTEWPQIHRQFLSNPVSSLHLVLNGTTLRLADAASQVCWAPTNADLRTLEHAIAVIRQRRGWSK